MFWGRIYSKSVHWWIEKVLHLHVLDGIEDDFLSQDAWNENYESDCEEKDNGEEESENENSELKSLFPENVVNTL
jgi:hypothetical protein